jgi:alpha-beta hydrolase superfamily lysophospholipase
MIFKRVLQLLFLLAGVAAGMTFAVVAFFTRRLVAPPRQPLWANPSHMGLPFEIVQFPARDSVRLSGWFVPGAGGVLESRTTVILVHDWTWNRLGDAAADLIADFSGTTPVELLRLTYALHQEGFNVLMYDQRNHGESATHPPVTFGQSEANDLLGAVSYLSRRDDVDEQKIAAIGFSMGANAILYALPQTDQIRAAIAVQPTTVSTYAARYAEDLLGTSGKVILPLVESAYAMLTGVRLKAIQPAFAAAGGGATPVLFIQSKSDKWGSMEDVNRLKAATPYGEGPLYVDGTHRYEGYQYLIENPKVAVAFFERNI